jgi:hypothetical protein
MPWKTREVALAPNFARSTRPGRSTADEDLFDPTLQLAGTGISSAGRPRLPIRLMAALLYLKPAYNLSDEALVGACSFPIFQWWGALRTSLPLRSDSDWTVLEGPRNKTHFLGSDFSGLVSRKYEAEGVG